MTTIGATLLGGAWLWGKFGDKVTEQAGKLVGDAGRQAWKKIDWQGAAERYRQEMQMRYGTMRIVGMAQPVALADIFTDVFLLDKPSAWRRYNIAELQRQARLESQQNRHRDERRDALDLVRRHERLMILGKPGAGKTTLLKHLVLQCTTGKLDAVPIFVGLKPWADSGLTLMPFLTRQFTICAFPDAQPFIEHILLEGRALVLFDGLDEVNLEQGARERITHEVRDFADQYPRSQCVITCRTAASDYQFERFAYCELADFTQEQTRAFVTHWFQRDEAKRAAFLTEIAKPEHDRLRDLTRTPLLLTLLCLAFAETMAFPPRRAELYEEALDALLKKWDTSRSIKRDTVYRQLSPGHKHQMLARIAAESFANNQLFMRQGDLAERIMTYLAKLPQAEVAEEIDGEAILRSIEAQHGLLVERAQRIYSFSHLTFHEYFTARYTVEHPSRQMFDSVVAHAHDARWREVLLLTASMLDDANAEIFFDAFDAALRAMIQGEPVLLSLLQWMERKAAVTSAAWQRVVRESYLVLALITVTSSSLLDILDRARNLDHLPNLVRVHNLARDLDHPFARAFAGARERARDLTRVRNLARDLVNPFDRVRDLVRGLAPNLDRDLTHARDLVNALDRTSTFVRGLGSVRNSDMQPEMMAIFQTDCVWMGILLWVELMASNHLGNPIRTDYAELLSCWRQQTAVAPPKLHAALTNLTLPGKDAPTEDWKQFTADLRAALYNVPQNSDKKGRCLKVHHPLCVNNTPQPSRPSSCARC